MPNIQHMVKLDFLHRLDQLVFSQQRLSCPGDLVPRPPVRGPRGAAGPPGRAAAGGGQDDRHPQCHRGQAGLQDTGQAAAAGAVGDL